MRVTKPIAVKLNILDRSVSVSGVSCAQVCLAINTAQFQQGAAAWRSEVHILSVNIRQTLIYISQLPPSPIITELRSPRISQA